MLRKIHVLRTVCGGERELVAVNCLKNADFANTFAPVNRLKIKDFVEQEEHYAGLIFCGIFLICSNLGQKINPVNVPRP